MTTDPDTHVATRLASELRSVSFTSDLTDEERLARLRAARAVARDGASVRAADRGRALAGLGLVAAAATATVLIVNVVSTSTAPSPAAGQPASGSVQVGTPSAEPSLVAAPADDPNVNGRYPVPTQRSDGSSRMALISGRLGGQLVGDTVCLWIKDASGDRTGLILESGSTAQLDPLRLIGPGGLVLAEDGDVIQGTGGQFATPPAACDGLASSGATLSGVRRVATD